MEMSGRFTAAGCRVALCGLLVLGSTLVLPAADIAVVKSGAAKSPIDCSGLSAGGGDAARVCVETLCRDLERSGWFIPATGPDVALAVTGRCGEDGGRLLLDVQVANRASGRRYLSESLRDEPGRARDLAHRVADLIVREIRGVPGIASTRIAMIRAHAGGKDLYVCDYDGARMVRVTSDASVCLSPRWGPEGESLVYTSMHQGFPDVYRIDMRSGRRTRIVKFPGLNAGASLAPDGRRLVVTLSKDGNPDLYVIDLRNGDERRLTRTGHAAEASPSWSRDGRRIVYVSDSSGAPQLYVMDADGGRARRLTFRGSENVAPDWGPDGRIAYSSRRDRQYQICVLNPESGDRVQLTAGAADYEDPSWAPDSRHIVCSKTEGYRSQVYVLDTLGDPPVGLTTLEGDWYSPAWSPK